MRKLLVIVLVPLTAAVMTLLLVEGVANIARWRHGGQSLVYEAYSALRGAAVSSEAAQPGFPLATRDQIEALIPDMAAAGVGMGNVPYKELVTDRAAINGIDADGCRAPKPSLDKITTYIRSGDFDRFDPPSLFYDRASQLTPALRDFIETYGVRKSSFTSAATGERTTLPATEAVRKILIAGDSVAVGSMIGDSETIASHLQAQNPSRQFVNLGVNGATAADIVCRLARAAERYAGTIDGLVYVYCENDFDPSLPFGKPEEVIAWLVRFAEDNRIPHVTVVFAPYIYNIVPGITRFPGSRGALHPTYAEAADRLKTEVRAAGFDYVSIGDIARREAVAKGSDFAALSLFVDHVHLSESGTALLVSSLPAAVK